MKNKKTLANEEIKHLAKLSALDLTDEEIEKYGDQLSETLDYVENLNELKTATVKEAHSVTESKDVFFEDGAENKRSLKEEIVFRNSKKTKNSQFVVDRILKS
ncbi:hypothetical protein A3G67_04185 [Candidatus Roizmanbacteria bacterium RIFCSPLOWO2_12_FULL_40_12]|uniref:Aspartyl/glutamyl-tRNA(Asn/Gln) amidotransferase subunit C n=1 Tax=Candidatus Roizmanbacteria bacterium RIFCSPLOWO2_01_FULL_40_42 TaxID=1802066 RepID=A0A1F7J6P3_9BACT|nr:MAG: hypothetical protein A2779_00705 [Candidatus Roizmanbacteria bacterium RIFCSPHIGHO2_01_FULL_40_98]OGK29166.1 MAG: hypothetical protein A3C31_02680 [Candidatus Roizmanbacteria bacterium RIFCSPHIGHO2_02_FULL_40_53]OGK30707.1 MAG: hypothetical protein A2W49_01750 [Candidatus Roizmanbacteria bacterium RIFCSPHIGHO2_12_41_18]OGK37202.1 MAG: hypothetical protein A3E69_01890 [Candidatus Roizmanbacteria bacterium RIFCSPHIGHO2_12_FULL_40_130]OGK51276.1 MAG: hypothetical protein A3B50_04765 [Candi